MQNFKAFQQESLQQVNQRLQQLSDSLVLPAGQLQVAMQYSLLDGGKRLRPLLCASTAALFSDNTRWLDSACAVEMLHCYSLIHDDLPAMDDDALRRGKATNHIKFNEATAILAGDALLTLAFEVLANSQLTASDKVKQMQLLSHASGARGMVAGQSLDLAATDQRISLAQLQKMHQLKTGALIKAAILMGAYSQTELHSNQLQALTLFAEHLGLAFQVMDDVLDVTADTATLGKPQGSDLAQNKSTYVSHLGLQAAQQKAEQLIAEAKQSLRIFPNNQYLCCLADFVLSRKN